MTRTAILSSVLKRRFLPALLTFSAVVGGAIAYLRVAEPSYVAKARLAISDPSVSVSELGRTLTQLPNNNIAADPIAAQAELIASTRILDSVFQALQNSGELGSDTSLESSEDLRSALSVKIVPATNFLEISFEGEQPELSAKIVNTIANSMVQLSSEDIRREASSVRIFLDEQIPQQQERLTQVEEFETRYREETGIVDINTQTSSLVGSLAALQDQERVLANQLKAALTQRSLLQNMTGFEQPEAAYVATRIGQDQELQDLKVSIQETAEEIIEARSRFLDSRPEVQSLNQQLSDIQSLYRQRLNQLVAGEATNNLVLNDAKASNPLSQDLISRYILSTVESESLAAQLQATQQNQQGIQAQLASLPARSQKLKQIERQRDELNAGLNLLQTKFQEAKIAEAQLVSNVRVIDYATAPSESAAPQAAVILLLSTIAGTAFAIGVVLLLEVFDRKLHNASDVEAETDVPVIGVLPRAPRRQLDNNLASFLDNADAVEPHRGLLKVLELSSAQKPNLLVFTSTRRGEGKSDVVARLGMVASMLSRRTLIIDADLKEPSHHGIFGTPELPGLTHAVLNEASLKEAIHSSGYQNLDVLPYGRFLQRPSRVSESPRMQEILEQVSHLYDLILVDTPPMTDSADAMTLGKYSDGLVFTVRPNLTGRDDLTDSLMLPRKNGIKVAGVVVNETPSLVQIFNEEDRLASQLPLSSHDDNDLHLLRSGSRNSL